MKRHADESETNNQFPLERAEGRQRFFQPRWQTGARSVCLISDSMNNDEAKCQWPNCFEPALCSSGNFANKLVCRTHFRVTNGDTFAEYQKLEAEIAELRDRIESMEREERESHERGEWKYTGGEE